MELFAGHKLLKEQDGYIIVLYLNRELTEFAQDFDYLDDSSKQDFKNNALNYIKEKFPGLKVKTIKILLGSLLIASVPVGAVHALDNAPASSAVIEKTETYSVRYGDTLYKIAQKYNTTVNSVKSKNNLKSDIIFPGQRIMLPSSYKSEYTIVYGDTLSTIADKFGTTVEKLKSINGLSDDLIIAGKKLKIPVRHSYRYFVKPSDTLYKIARQFGVSIKEIRDANNISGDLIIIGQTLLIPNNDAGAMVSNPASVLVVANKKTRLPDNYVPDNLVVPNVMFLTEEFHQKKLMRKDAAEALEQLFDQAKVEGIVLYAVSGYRAYERQEAIFTSKTMERGLDIANRTSAKPGESEHQTGLAMDITSASAGYMLSESFGETLEGKWIKNNAARFGFILRYPKGKEHITGYNYEPWHVRYVGREVAEQIADRGITLEEYN